MSCLESILLWEWVNFQQKFFLLRIEKKEVFRSADADTLMVPKIQPYESRGGDWDPFQK